MSRSFIVSFFQNRQPGKAGRFKLVQPVGQRMNVVEADTPRDAVEKSGCHSVEKGQDPLTYGLHSSDCLFPAYMADPGFWVFAVVSET